MKRDDEQLVLAGKPMSPDTTTQCSYGTEDDMEDMQTPEEAIVAEVDEIADTPDDGTLVAKVTFTDILIT